MPVEGQEGVWIEQQGKKLLNFTSFSYLGLYDHPEIKQAAKDAIDEWGVGLQGTRLLGGNISLYNLLEDSFRIFLKKEAALLFQSGYAANVATIQSLMKRGDVIFCAKKNHASILDGCRISKAEIILFDHKDMSKLKQMIAAVSPESLKLIVVDSVFSMDGDLVDLPALLEIRDIIPNTLVMLDESHSLGVVGASGRGLEEYFGIPTHKGADLVMASLSKAIPGNGGILAGDREVIRYLRFQTRHTIFSSGLPPATVAATIQALRILEREGKERIDLLNQRVWYLRKRLQEIGIVCHHSPSPITSILINQEKRAFEIARRCHSKGLFVFPVVFPAVARGLERLRLTITLQHTEKDIDKGVEILASSIVE